MKVNPAKVWLRLVFASTVDGLWAELFSKKRVCINTMYAAEPYVAQEDSGGKYVFGQTLFKVFNGSAPDGRPAFG
jgi:hypothetical protein